MSMQITSGSVAARNVVFDYIHEDIPGGVSLDTDRFNATEVVEQVLAGTPVYVDKTNRIAYIVKTSTVLTGSSGSAVRVTKGHHWVAGDFVSDGIEAEAIASITVGTGTYDTLNFSTGLTKFTVGTIIFQTSAANMYQGSHAQVQDTAGDYLDIYDPSFRSNGLRVTISQNGSDNLAVSYSAGILTIALASGTESKNNVSAVQAAIRALTNTDYPFPLFFCVGTDWDGKQKGATLTTATADFASTYYDLYVPNGFVKDSIYFDDGADNQDVSVVLSGAVRNSALPFPLHQHQKDLMTRFTFNY